MIVYVLLVLVIALCGNVAILLLLFLYEREERKLWEQREQRERGRVCELLDEVAELRKREYRLRAVLDEKEDDDGE